MNTDMIYDGDSFVLNVKFEPEVSNDFKSIARTLRIKFIHSEPVVTDESKATYTWEHSNQTIYDEPDTASSSTGAATNTVSSSGETATNVETTS